MENPHVVWLTKESDFPCLVYKNLIEQWNKKITQ